MLKLKLHTWMCTHQIVQINQASRLLNLLLWNTCTCIFHQVENWFSLLKKANLSDYYLGTTVYWSKTVFYLCTFTFTLNIKLIVKINTKKSCVIIEQCWSILTSVFFCYCSGVHTRLHHGQHVPSTAVWGRKYFRWSRKGKLCPHNRRWLDQIPGWFNQGILLLLYFFNYL